MTSAERASGVQAAGSIVAIVATVCAVDRQHHRALATDRMRVEVQAQERMDRMTATVLQAQSLVGTLTVRDLGARPRAWNRSFNDDIALALAPVEFLLERFRAMLDVPIGANVVKTMNEAAVSLVAAKP